jgi:anti-sigma28 factor (negative regulator of flagellin synthesis)
MVNDSATLSPPAATPHPAMAGRVAWLREQIERGAYEIDLAALAVAMLGFGTRQIPDSGSPSKI